MGRKTTKIILIGLWSVLLCVLLWAGLCDLVIPDTLALATGEEIPSYPCISLVYEEENGGELGQAQTMSARLFGVVSLKKIEVKDYSGLRLVPSGQTLGVRLTADGVCVVGIAEVEGEGKHQSPAAAAGLVPKDMILAVNDSPVRTVADVKAIVESSGGAPLKIRYQRGAETRETTLTPLKCATDGKYKTGMWIKDSATGIGTVTFVDPRTGEFGALGHGVCDEGGVLLPLSRGVVTDAVVSDVVKGKKGTPGELHGYLKPGKTGVLTKNTECGVFGAFATPPTGEALPIGTRAEIKTGKATLRTMLDGAAPTDYEIEIVQIHDKTANKSFTVRVTDARLLEKTGGIVQGMSGSPIIQNGKLVGAITHVMISDPTSGYGIFIENMLNAANNPMAKAS